MSKCGTKYGINNCDSGRNDEDKKFRDVDDCSFLGLAEFLHLEYICIICINRLKNRQQTSNNKETEDETLPSN